MFRSSTRGLAFAAVMLLTGCHLFRARPAPPPAAPPPAAVASAWPARRAELQQRPHYEVKGRVAVAAGGEGFNAHLHWVQEGPRTQLQLAGPLGAGGVQVSAEGDHLTIVDAHGKHLSANAAKAQLHDRLGFDPPLSSLRFWMLGVPDPGQPAGQEVLGDDLLHLAQLQQSGWQIDYTAYMPAGGGESLPAKVTLQRADVRVRLIVDSWGD